MRASPEQQRLAAVGLLVAALALLWAAAVPIVDAFDAQRQRLAHAEDTLARFRQVAAQRPALERRLVEAKARLDGRNAYLRGGDKAVAGAALQTTIRETVRAHGGEVSSTQTLPGEIADGFRRVAVESRMSVTLDGLRAILHALETARPHLFVDDLTIRVRPAPRLGGAAPEPRLLDVAMTASGFMEAQTASLGDGK